MLEKKFRAWGKNSKEYLRDSHGYGLTLKEIQNIADIDLWEFEQFTGAKDDDDKEIYEGDIVEYNWYIVGTQPTYRVKSVVNFDSHGARVSYDNHNDDVSECIGVKIVGNIRESKKGAI